MLSCSYIGDILHAAYQTDEWSKLSVNIPVTVTKRRVGEKILEKNLQRKCPTL